MVRATSPARLMATALLAVTMAVVPEAVMAQSGFMLRRPAATVSLLGGWAFPGEGSDLFEFTRQELTVDDGDFAAPAIGLELAYRATEQLDVAVSIERAARTVDSELREWVTLDDLPIRQSTSFDRTRLLGTVRGYLFPRGRQISRFSWIPNRWSPYLGLGGGVSWYEFVQEGDFVDYETANIFEETFEENGRGWTGHAVAGVQLSLAERFLVRGEYRYIWGDADMPGTVFSGFGDLDMSGSTVLIGVGVRL